MKIQQKLFSIFTFFTVGLVLVLVFAMQWSINSGMVDYVNQKEIEALSPVKESLQEHYTQVGSWQVLAKYPRRFDQIIRQSLQGNDVINPPPPRPPHKDKRRKPPRPLERGQPVAPNRAGSNLPPRERPSELPKKRPMISFALLDVNKQLISGDFPAHKDFNFLELDHKQQLVGYLAVSKRKHLMAGYELDFIEQQRQHLWWFAIGVLVVTLSITLPLATHFLNPIRALAKGMSKLTKGDFQQRLNFKRKDEFSQLSRDFNQLATTLDSTEAARKRWLANISHELRTPVAIIKGELEAMIDGIRPLSKQQVSSCHQEVSHLQRLIEDLHTLTSADIGGMNFRKESGDLIEFLHHESQRIQCYLANEGWELAVKLPKAPVVLNFDSTRICQLLENLVSNSVKYAEGGSKLTISADLLKQNNQLELVVEDDGCGVEKSQLPLLFEHLFRGDGARQGRLDGSGLGLAICSHIVQGHNGSVVAKQSSAGGLAIVITLPC